MILDLDHLPRGPLLIFDAEEINTIRAMLLRSDWRCEVTDRMREFLETPEVIQYRYRKRREAALAAAARAQAFFPEQVAAVMLSVEPEVTIGNMDAWCEAFRRTDPCLYTDHVVDGIIREAEVSL
jgi:hypothetical protein